MNYLLFMVLIISILTSSFSHNKYEDLLLVRSDEEYAVSQPCDSFGSNFFRKQKRNIEKPIKSKVLDVMLNTPMYHLNRSQPNIFDAFADQYELPKGFKGPLKQYDFIVVGAGSAGSVLAARLSEGKKASVLLLETGEGEPIISGIPAVAPVLQQTDYVWHYFMEHQPEVCMGMINERCFWPRGKAVGGSSVVNYMVYTRGLPVDWDRIAARGNYGWSYQEVLPFYLKSERANLRGLNNSPWHGKNGELNVEDVPFRSKLSKAFLDAAQILGNRRVDYNSPDGFGFSFIQATINKGIRTSSAKAFLHNNKKRKNLHILTKSRVTKILIDPQTKTAYGVEFQREGRKYTIHAAKEVILSAGPIESPHLLMLSGVGPAEHLTSFGINVLQDLKVGETLYDHISFPGLTFLLNSTQLTLVERNIATIQNMLQYTQFGDGPFSSLAGVETIGYIKTNESEELGDVPDIELLGSCASLASDEGNIVAKGLHLTDWLYNDVFKPIENLESFTVLFMLLHPKSKGSLRLGSRNPFEPPKLYGNYLTHPKDVATTVAAIRYIIKLIDTPPFKKYGAKLYKKKYPNCVQYDFDSDKYWECAVRTITSTLHHQIATCKMGPVGDPSAIVDPELRVHGIRNLRVADSSIIPSTLAAHTNAPAIMIGEKAADLLKSTWGL